MEISTERQIEIFELMKTKISKSNFKSGIFDSLFLSLYEKEITPNEHDLIKQIIFSNQTKLNKKNSEKPDLWLYKTTKNPKIKKIFKDFFNEIIYSISQYKMDINRQIEILNLVIKDMNELPYSSIYHSLLNLLDDKLIITNEYFFIKNLIDENKPTETNQYANFYKIRLFKTSVWLLKLSNDHEIKKVRTNYLTELINNIK